MRESLRREKKKKFLEEEALFLKECVLRGRRGERRGVEGNYWGTTGEPLGTTGESVQPGRAFFRREAVGGNSLQKLNRGKCENGEEIIRFGMQGGAKGCTGVHVTILISLLSIDFAQRGNPVLSATATLAYKAQPPCTSNQSTTPSTPSTHHTHS